MHFLEKFDQDGVFTFRIPKKTYSLSADAYGRRFST